MTDKRTDGLGCCQTDGSRDPVLSIHPSAGPSAAVHRDIDFHFRRVAIGKRLKCGDQLAVWLPGARARDAPAGKSCSRRNTRTNLAPLRLAAKTQQIFVFNIRLRCDARAHVVITGYDVWTDTELAINVTCQLGACASDERVCLSGTTTGC